jgi:hypothetical protein
VLTPKFLSTVTVTNMPTYALHSSKTTNPPSDAQSAGCGFYESLVEAITQAEQEAALFGCERRPERETERVVFYADKFEPSTWTPPKPPKPPCPRCGYPGPRLPRPPLRRPIPGIPIGTRYEVKVTVRG